jgi:hypothetical protein
MLRVDSRQRHRLADIIDNLQARIEEAIRNRWLGEVQGLQISLDEARAKMADIERITRTQRTGPTLLGMSARSVALAGFGFDSLIEIGASTVVIWELSGAGEDRRRALRLIGGAFEGRVTLIDGILAAAVLAGLVLNAGLGWWSADPLAGYILVFYAVHETREIFFGSH